MLMRYFALGGFVMGLSSLVAAQSMSVDTKVPEISVNSLYGGGYDYLSEDANFWQFNSVTTGTTYDLSGLLASDYTFGAEADEWLANADTVYLGSDQMGSGGSSNGSLGAVLALAPILGLLSGGHGGGSTGPGLAGPGGPGGSRGGGGRFLTPEPFTMGLGLAAAALAVRRKKR